MEGGSNSAGDCILGSRVIGRTGGKEPSSARHLDQLLGLSLDQLSRWRKDNMNLADTTASVECQRSS